MKFGSIFNFSSRVMEFEFSVWWFSEGWCFVPEGHWVG